MRIPNSRFQIPNKPDARSGLGVPFEIWNVKFEIAPEALS
jgi:hypothetical protein